MSREHPQLALGRRATLGYAHLLFAFGFARLGDEQTARSLQGIAPDFLLAEPKGRELQALACQAFDYRISEALSGQLHGTPIGGNLGQTLEAFLGRPYKAEHPATAAIGSGAYPLSQLLARLRVLQPAGLVNPYDYALFDKKKQQAGQRPQSSVTDEGNLGPLSDPEGELELALAPPRPDEKHGEWFARHTDFIRRTVSVAFDVRADLLVRFFARVSPMTNTYMTGRHFSLHHLRLLDATILAVVGTGARLPEDEWPEHRRVLHHLRPAVLSWIERVP